MDRIKQQDAFRAVIKQLAIFIVAISLAGVNYAQSQEIPSRPSPPRLVNDFTGTLSQQEQTMLERKLRSFNDTTSTQIAVVLVSDFGGLDKAAFAYRLGENWGVGQKGFDNGIVVAIKPKEVGASRGEAFIATGYGVEGVVPDAIANRIVEQEMIPAFKQQKYFAGINRGTDVLMKLTAGEYSAQDYKKQTSQGKKTAGYIVPILAMIIAIFLMKRSQGSRRTFARRRSGAGTGFLTALLLMGLGGGHRGQWNEFSSGSGHFGGGMGSDFGGFGGGGFGGGGAGGSW